MNICCIICSDAVIPSSDNYSTPCGHIFHYVCLLRWLEQSKTCPQCRVKTTDKTIHRIYFNLTNTDHIEEDVGTLQAKLDSMQYDMKLKEKDVKIYSEKYNVVKGINLKLTQEIAQVEGRVKSLESILHSYKEQVNYYKARCKELSNLGDETTKLRNKLKEVESVQTLIHGTRDEVNDMIRNQNCIEQLAMNVSILKKTLHETEKKKSISDSKSRQLQSELIKKTRETAQLERTNQNLLAKMEAMKKNWTSEKKYLTSVVEDMHKTAEKGHTPTIKRILNESPLPVPKKYRNDVNINTTITYDDEDDDENAGASGVKKSFFVESPRDSIFSVNMEVVKPAKYKDITKIKTSPVEDRLSRFQQFKVAVMTRDDMGYDGLGGRSVEHVFPSPSTSSTQTRVMKRKKAPVTSLSSVKFKKLGSQ